MFEFAMKMKTTILRVLVLASVGLGMAAGAGATPVTFAFEANVDFISLGASFDSEIGLAAGDVITGQFTFEPNAGDGSDSFEVNQPYAFSLKINGIELSTAAFKTTVLDDAGIIVDCVDLSCPSVVDILELDENGLSASSGTVLPNLASESSGFRLSLGANADSTLLDENFDPIPLIVVLDTAEIPADVGVWNQFTGRSLQVWLEDAQGGTYRFNATVGQFTVIPEPSSVSLVYIGIVVVGLAARIGRRLQNQC